MIEIVVSIFLLAGGALSVLAAVGVLRLPDVYGRLHAATKSATLGVISIILGVFFYFLLQHGIVVGKLLLTIIFVFLTAPVAAFMIARSAYNVKAKMSDKSIQDDLAEALKKQKSDSK